jgi:hypothetical protein
VLFIKVRLIGIDFSQKIMGLTDASQRNLESNSLHPTDTFLENDNDIQVIFYRVLQPHLSSYLRNKRLI